jgi:hypothetical protein
MTVRTFILLLASVMLLIHLGGCGSQPTAPDDGILDQHADEGAAVKNDHNTDAWWDDQSQETRNQAIITRARQDLGRYTRKSCKEWVRTVVLSASRQLITIPSNREERLNNGAVTSWRWLDHARVRTVFQNSNANRAAAEFAAAPGHVIQSELRASPWLHTQIVTSVSRNGFEVIDANRARYVAGRDTGYVATKSYTWAQWRTFAARFTVYEIR